jgi:hypothetical protein
MKTVDVGPFQTIFHRVITSRPRRRPKFLESFGFVKHCCKSKGSLHDPICKLRNGDKLIRKFKSITKVGMDCGPAAVPLVDSPVGKRLRCSANVMSIEVTLAPVSRWAIVRIDEGKTLFGGPLNTVAVEISTGIFMPVEHNSAEPIFVDNIVPGGGGGVILKSKLRSLKCPIFSPRLWRDKEN